MGYGLSVVAVDLAQLRADVGCADVALAEKYGAQFTTDHPDVQDHLDATTLADIARHMVMGEEYDQRYGFAYGYFVKFLAKKHGTELPVTDWYPVSVDFPSTFDAALAEQGLLTGYSAEDLAFGGSPVPIPPIDDFPGIGYLRYAELGGALDVLKTAPTTELAEEFQGHAYELFQWMAAAHQTRRDLVGFFH